MRVLVFGGTGMLGHRVVYELAKTETVFAPRRWAGERYTWAFAQATPLAISNLTTEEAVREVFQVARPEVVINCAGVVKGRMQTAGMAQAILVNSVLPHRLVSICREWRARLIHVSTDCVFSGQPRPVHFTGFTGHGADVAEGAAEGALADGHLMLAGGYTEVSPPDPSDDYGRSKLLGEVGGPDVLTLRTSFIGRDLGPQKTGLLEWLLSRDETPTTPGYVNHVWSGLTSNELARVIARIVKTGRPDFGLYHVGGQTVTKHDLLVKLAAAYGVATKVLPADAGVGVSGVNRSLNSKLFWSALGGGLTLCAPPLDALIEDLLLDNAPYTPWKKTTGGRS